MKRTSGAWLVVGSVVFILGVLLPANMAFFSTTDVAARIEGIEAGRAAWAFSQLLLIVGSVTAAIGLLAFAQHLRKASATSGASAVAQWAAVTGILGAALYAAICVFRIVASPETVALDQNWGGVLYPVSVFASSIAIALAGVAVVLARMSSWLGWVLVLAGLAILAQYLITWDMLPIEYYLPVLVMGLAFVFISDGRSAATAPS